MSELFFNKETWCTCYIISKQHDATFWTRNFVWDEEDLDIFKRGSNSQRSLYGEYVITRSVSSSKIWGRTNFNVSRRVRYAGQFLLYAHTLTPNSYGSRNSSIFYVLRSLSCSRNVLRNIESSSNFLTLQFYIMNHNFLHLKISIVRYILVFLI